MLLHQAPHRRRGIYVADGQHFGLVASYKRRSDVVKSIVALLQKRERQGVDLPVSLLNETFLPALLHRTFVNERQFADIVEPLALARGIDQDERCGNCLCSFSDHERFSKAPDRLTCCACTLHECPQWREIKQLDA